MIRWMKVAIAVGVVVVYGPNQVEAREDQEVKRVANELSDLKRDMASGNAGAEQRLRNYIAANIDVIDRGLQRWKALTDREKKALYKKHSNVLAEVASSAGFHDIASYTMRWFGDRTGLLAINADNVEQTIRALRYGVYLPRWFGLNNFDRIAPTNFNSNYFTYGYTDHPSASGGQDIKFQISVKTKVFKSARGGWAWANGLTLAYTQLSIFDINGRSSPFRATNYNPDLLFVWGEAGRPLWGLMRQLRLSLYDHNSTGVDSTNSRRWERMYVEPRFAWSMFSLMYSLRAKLWIETPYKDGISSRNRDIEDFLGHGQLALRIKHSDRLGGEIALTRGDETGLNYAAEAFWRPPKLDFFLFVQGYYGYGEELIGYNVETKSIRGGIRFN